MTENRDRPPVLRALVLLLALVGSALALAALSPAGPDAAADGKSGTGAAGVAPVAKGSAHP